MVSPIGLSPRPVKKEPVANQPASGKNGHKTYFAGNEQPAPKPESESSASQQPSFEQQLLYAFLSELNKASQTPESEKTNATNTTPNTPSTADTVEIALSPKVEEKQQSPEAPSQNRIQRLRQAFSSVFSNKDATAKTAQASSDTVAAENVPLLPKVESKQKKPTESVQTQTVTNVPKTPETPQPTATAEEKIIAQLKTEIEKIAASKNTPFPKRNKRQEEDYNKILKQSASRILKKHNTPPQAGSKTIFMDESGVGHNNNTLNKSTQAEQTKFLNSAAANIYEQHIEPAFKKAQRVDAQSGPKTSNQPSLWNQLQQLFTSILPGNNSDTQPTTVAPKTAAAKTVNPQGQPAAKIPGAFPTAETEQAKISGKKTSTDNADKTPKAEGLKKADSTEDPAKTGDSNTPQTPTNDANKKDEEENGGILHGWKKTKLATGAGLIAGGIALKMTLIGIVPGLIMSGVGAALMGWGALNYLFSGKKDETKKEGEQAPAAS